MCVLRDSVCECRQRASRVACLCECACSPRHDRLMAVRNRGDELKGRVSKTSEGSSGREEEHDAMGGDLIGRAVKEARGGQCQDGDRRFILPENNK